MRTSYNPSEDLKRLIAAGATADQIEHIISIRRRLWRLRYGRASATEEPSGSPTAVAHPCPAINLVEALWALMK